MTATPMLCRVCGGTKFLTQYRGAVAASRFLWWKTAPRDEALEITCTRCGYEWTVAPGSIRVRPEETPK